MRSKHVVALALGATLLIAAVAGFVIVPEHKPVTTYVDTATGDPCTPRAGCATVHAGFSQSIYDVARIGTWALLIVGLLIVIVALMQTRESR